MGHACAHIWPYMGAYMGHMGVAMGHACAHTWPYMGTAMGHACAHVWPYMGASMGHACAHIWPYMGTAMGYARIYRPYGSSNGACMRAPYMGVYMGHMGAAMGHAWAHTWAIYGGIHRWITTTIPGQPGLLSRSWLRARASPLR